MSKDMISLADGYEGGVRVGGQLGDAADSIHGISKQQGNTSMDFLGTSKGGFASQVSNSGVATGEAIGANSSEHASSANNHSRFVQNVGTGEQVAQDGMKSPISDQQGVAQDIFTRITPA